jgi:hypothetical protein
MRTTISSIAKVGRSAQGVHVMNVGAGDRLASVALIDLAKRPEPPAASNGSNGSNGGSSGGGRRRITRRK